MSIEELQACVGPPAKQPEQEQASRTVRFDLGHGGDFDVGHVGHDLGLGGRHHVGGASRGGTRALDMNKTEESDGVGGIEMTGLHEVDGTDSTAELDGHWEGNQFIQVRGGLTLRAWGFMKMMKGKF